MTSTAPKPLTDAAPAAAPDTPPPLGRTRRILRAVAIAGCLPYLVLKIIWVAGGEIGIPPDSSLLEHRTTMALANAGTVLMDGAVIVLVLLLTRPWGLRVPAWLLVVPLWIASGLLSPIVAGYPLQMVVRLFPGAPESGTTGASEPFLDDWVFAVVYPGFIVQALALGSLFVLYARDRWGHLWQGRLRDLPRTPTGPAQRITACAVALLTLLPVSMHLAWVAGSRSGLHPSRADEYTRDSAVLDLVYVGFSVATVVGVLLLAFPRGRSLPVRVPLALAWVGSGALGCWGGWMLVTSLAAVDDLTQQPTPVVQLTYAVQMIVGMLVAAFGAYFFAERAAAERTSTGRPPHLVTVPAGSTR
ncbi:hypothetical protein DSC45_11470 [Streptomyces sp. YIM 130001]|uniref:hypothetical protein n=1 Tax=Streptomyces sp. YIM 130001 TaxID=2259644 RepID=UPI000E64FD02|nr:hypothetical protein [Streptomyces sp. YIM 130001]RII18529.1 hypothetical protein DSC45_11470 [Streptomyces sp. YIM 130001]